MQSCKLPSDVIGGNFHCGLTLTSFQWSIVILKLHKRFNSKVYLNLKKTV